VGPFFGDWSPMVAFAPESLGIPGNEAAATPGLDRQHDVIPLDVDLVEALFLVAKPGRGSRSGLDHKCWTGTGRKVARAVR